MNSLWCAIVLAAGKGKRMQSELPKVIHEINKVPMVLMVADAAAKVTSDIIIVVGHHADMVKSVFAEKNFIRFANQKNQNGTGDAVKSAVPEINEDVENVLVLCGDTPLIEDSTLLSFARDHEKKGAGVSVLAMEVENPKGYGRLVINEKNEIVKIVEEVDADEIEKKIKIVNSGIYCFKKEFLIKGLEKLGCENAQNEYYLTDLVQFSRESNNEKAHFHILKKTEEAMGVNTPEELKKAESILLEKLSIA